MLPGYSSNSLQMTVDKEKIIASIENSLKFYEYELTVPLTNFIFRTPLHWNVMLIIALATFKDEYVTSFQEICKSIPSKVGSKSSIQSIIENGIQEGFIFKAPLVKDMRVKSLTLTDKAKKDFEAWLKADAETYSPLALSAPF